MASRLFVAVLGHLREIETFISSIYRFFKCVDLASDDAGLSEAGFAGVSSSAVDADSSEEGAADPQPRPPRPIFDRALTGYGCWVDCGHNGILSEGEAQHFALHLRAAGFGTYCGPGQELLERREGARSSGRALSQGRS